MRIDFYIVEHTDQAAYSRFACRLLEKAFTAGRNEIFVYQPDSQLAAQFDELLWSFNDTSFVPHRLQSANDISAPIVIGNDPTTASEQTQLLINLSTTTPPQHERFERMLEIVSANDTSTARSRFKTYRDQGAELHSHTINLTT